jgi:hypothetical protein
MSKPYFDPRTGEQITESQFIQRYTVNAFLWVEHPPEAAQTNSLPGITKFGPTCPGCGTGVAREVSPGVGEPCAFCAEKPQFQQARAPMLQLGAQPKPAYAPAHEPEAS